MSCPGPETHVNKDMGAWKLSMIGRVAFLAQAPQLVLSVKHIYNTDVYPNPICAKYTCLAQLLKVCPAESGNW